MARRRPVPDARSRVSGSVAKRYVGCGMLFPDLIQESNMGLIKDPRDCGNSVWSGQPDAGLAGPLEGLGRCCEQNISRACLEMALPENTGVEQTVQLILQDGPAIVPCHARLRDGAVPGRVHSRELGRWFRLFDGCGLHPFARHKKY